jgi:hypothetical protein
MAKCMHHLLLTNSRLEFDFKKRFISISINGVTLWYYQSWFNAHVVEGWTCMTILLTLEQVVNGGTTNNLTKVVMG